MKKLKREKSGPAPEENLNSGSRTICVDIMLCILDLQSMLPSHFGLIDGKLIKILSRLAKTVFS